jgi:hypothetical protein
MIDGEGALAYGRRETNTGVITNLIDTQLLI